MIRSPRRGGLEPGARRSPASSEAWDFLAPAMGIAARGWQRAPFIMLLLCLAYACSGLTFIGADQAGLVLRFGAVTRSDGAPIVHPPGLLFALPRPFDEVIKVDVDRVSTIAIDELAPPSWRRDPGSESDDTQNQEPGSIDPERHGYVLTGDRNILHTQVIVRYQIGSPVDYSLLAVDRTEFIRTSLLESTIRVAGQTRLDDLLGGQRDLFSRAVAADAQQRLDRIGVGLDVISVEFENLSPPEQVSADFDAVQSAFIESETRVRDAQAYAASVVPGARAEAAQTIADAEAQAHATLATARADKAAFSALLHSYQAHPDVVLQRLYREGIEKALASVARLNFVPAPVTTGYAGTRFSISLREANNPLSADPQPRLPSVTPDLRPASDAPPPGEYLKLGREAAR